MFCTELIVGCKYFRRYHSANLFEVADSVIVVARNTKLLHNEKHVSYQTTTKYST